MMTDDFIQRFFFPELDIRGACVKLGVSWQALQAGRNYPEIISRLMGEMAAVTTLIAGNLKQPGRLSFQLSGQAAVKALLLDCTQDLHIRGLARFDPDIRSAPLPSLIGEGRLLLSLETPNTPIPYQSFVPLVGEDISAIFAHYLQQSEQQPTYLFLAANTDKAAGFLLQPLPSASQRDADAWNRIRQLAATLKAEELLYLSPPALLTRLFSEEDKRLFPPRRVCYHCPRDLEKIHRLLFSLGRQELDRILEEQGEVQIHDDMSHQHYRFSADEIAQIFAAQTDSS